MLGSKAGANVSDERITKVHAVGFVLSVLCVCVCVCVCVLFLLLRFVLRASFTSPDTRLQ